MRTTNDYPLKCDRWKKNREITFLSWVRKRKSVLKKGDDDSEHQLTKVKGKITGKGGWRGIGQERWSLYSTTNRLLKTNKAIRIRSFGNNPPAKTK